MKTKKKNKLLSPCNFNSRPMSFAAREMGCPLDHCMCGTHDSENKDHKCKPPSDYEDPLSSYYGF